MKTRKVKDRELAELTAETMAIIRKDDDAIADAALARLADRAARQKPRRKKPGSK